MKIIIMLVILLGILGADEYKAIFDCSSKDSAFIASRMSLIERTITMIEKRGDTVKFALTIHGGCTKMTTANLNEILEDAQMQAIQRAKESITRLSKKQGVEIVVCAMSLNAATIDEDDILPFIRISENSFIDTIHYQNKGYALMTFK
ncbi:DsrE family protein [Sulfurimonas sp. MAG313]|nr:DsrE family protein [Sulfurimonas sp. MAG313]MDF1880200.1 DsrE family protein [Sulfurimonas sp. MAG313]